MRTGAGLDGEPHENHSMRSTHDPWCTQLCAWMHRPPSCSWKLPSGTQQGAACGGPPRGARLLLPGLPQDGVRLDAHALHGVHHDQRAVAEPRRRAHLAAEVHMARRIDQVDKVTCARPGEAPVACARASQGLPQHAWPPPSTPVRECCPQTCYAHTCKLPAWGSRYVEPSRALSCAPLSSLSCAVAGTGELPGSPAAPGMCRRPMELDFMVMPRACSAGTASTAGTTRTAAPPYQQLRPACSARAGTCKAPASVLDRRTLCRAVQATARLQGSARGSAAAPACGPGRACSSSRLSR